MELNSTKMNGHSESGEPGTGSSQPEITLRLGDILPRIPPRFLKPGAHDSSREIHFPMEELCKEIERGRVAVSLSQITKLCPDIFRDELDLAENIEVPLPLQKLVEQIEVHPLPQRAHVSEAASQQGSQPIQTKANGHEPAPPTAALPTPATKPDESLPKNISLNLGAIFRLMPSEVLGNSEMPDEHARVSLPLAWIEPHLDSGHVEISLTDFISALPARIGAKLHADDENAKVWIPLDEIFQNLPPRHPFHFGGFDIADPVK